MSSRKIAINTMATYGRSVLAAAMALFSGRWVLAALGQSDFGLFSVVGSIIVFILFLSNVMSAGASRFFAYSIGRNAPTETNTWFNVSLSIHTFLGITLALLGWPIGEYVVRHVLTVPPDRVDACAWVFRLSLISAFATMVTVPFTAMFNAKQRIVEVAVIGLLQSAAVFGLAWFLGKVHGDLLLVYSAGMVLIILVAQLTMMGRAIASFPECQLSMKHWFNPARLKEMFSFTGWTLIGVAGSMLRDQGSALLLNLFFGPTVNAAYAVGTQVSAQTNQLSMSMVTAFSPEITASEGRGDRARMLSLSNQASKFGTILVLLFAIPLMVEMDYVLVLWLKHPPEHSATFCRFILSTFVLDRLTVGTMLSVSAHGRIAAYQATVGTCLLMTFPIGWVLLHSGLPATSIGYAFLITITAASLGRVLWARRLFQMHISTWIGEVLIPTLGVAFAASACALFVHQLPIPPFLRLALVGITSVLAAAVVGWQIAMRPNERQFAQRALARLPLFSRGISK